MLKVRAKLSNLFYFLALLFVMVVISGCAATKAGLDPLGNIDARQKNEQKKYALLCASHQVQKKYDLLEEELLERYQTETDLEVTIGKLFAIIDLAEFYTYGFVNYKKSLELFAEAEQLNEKINVSGLKHDTDDDEIITYYIAFGKYIIPRSYGFSKIERQISAGQKRINRIVQYQVGVQRKTFELPQITPQVTANYAFAIRVERNVLPPSSFSQFEEALSKTTREYFKRRHKLPKSKHAYYISFNILHGLATVFDFSSLSGKQIQTVLEYLKEAKNKRLKQTSDLESAYLDFVEILCLTELGKTDKAIVIFDTFQQKMVTINEDLNEYLEQLKASRDSAVTSATAKTIGFLALTVITMGQAAGSGGGLYLNMSPAGFLDYTGTVATLQRQLDFTGESTYAKQWNILLDIDDQLQLLRAIGMSYHASGNIEKSILYNREAVKIISNLRSTITTEEGRASFAGYRDKIYAYLVEDLFRAGKYDEAFYYAENSRSRSLVDLLGSKFDLSFGDKELDNYVKRVKDVQVYRDQLRGDVGTTDQQVSYVRGLEDELGRYQGNKSKTQKNEHVENKKKKNVSYKELLSLITVNNLNQREIQRIVPQESTLIEYFIGRDSIYAWVLDNNSFHPIDLNVNLNSAKKDILGFIKAIKAGPFSGGRGIKPRGQKLYKTLFKPLEKYIKNKTVYLVTHDFLHLLPFDALYFSKGFLVEKYAFSSLPSSSLLQFLEPLESVSKSLLALGNPTIAKKFDLADLPGAEQEVKKIANLFTDKMVAVRGEATESLFRMQSSNYLITHFASHALFDEQDPLNSQLFLATDEQNDGMLTAKELYELPDVSDLILLSACETARTKIGAGDELIGLLRGFFFSGASSVVATLWVVDDLGTQQLMERFYHHMVRDNKSPVNALQSAKQNLIVSDQHSSPFFWASFNLYGLGI